MQESKIRARKWAIFVSGTGSNFLSVMKSPLRKKVKVLVSSKKNAPAVAKARRLGLPVLILKKDGWDELVSSLKSLGVDAIFLLGFMKVLPESFLNQWNHLLLNLHPSLLPAYPGLKAIERAYKDGADVGVSIHHVIAELDAGHVVKQKRVYSPEGSSKKWSLPKVVDRVHMCERRLVRKVMYEFS